MSEKDPASRKDRFEDYPLTRLEYIQVMVHFYRGEVQRSTAWRERLDATTNWAVLTTAGILSFSFATPENPHIVLLLGNLILLAYLIIESRRYRYFVVYRARVRMIEENFLIPVITRQLESPMVSWREMLAMDLDLPKYKTTFFEAMGFRLRRNYIWVLLIMFGGWCVKVSIHPKIALSAGELWTRIGVGPLSPVFIITTSFLFYASLVAIIWWGWHLRGDEPEDEIAGLERNLDHWKL